MKEIFIPENVAIAFVKNASLVIKVVVQKHVPSVDLMKIAATCGAI